ncbi:MAG: hypothetical protein P4L73_14445 [Caulobacteraceae bacterium]|nr:hypothetical protein [Caulobacteraceae bacterium]
MTRTAWAGAAAASILGLAALLAAGQARSAVTVFANDQAHACYLAAKLGDLAQTGLDDCTQAIGGAPMSDHDLAGTFVNRGVIYMLHGRYRPAQADFEAALKLDTTLGEAYVNHGAALIAQRRYAEGIADIDRGLPLGPQEPEKAYYNRAIADEALDDVKDAYFDYLKAAQLKPAWAAPKAELARFTVRRP